MSACMERDLHRQVRATLWAGLTASLCAIVAGFAWTGLSGVQASGLVPLDRLLPMLLCGEPGALVAVGVLILLLTPVATVVTGLFHFAAKKEWPWVGISLTVLAVLAAGVLVAGR